MLNNKREILTITPPLTETYFLLCLSIFCDGHKDSLLLRKSQPREYSFENGSCWYRCIRICICVIIQRYVYIATIAFHGSNIKCNTIINSWDFITRFARVFDRIHALNWQIVFLHYTRTLSWLASSGLLVFFFSLVANFRLRMMSVVLQTSRLSTILPTCKSFLYPFFCVSTVSPALIVNRNEFCNSPSACIPKPILTCTYRVHYFPFHTFACVKYTYKSTHKSCITML